MKTLDARRRQPLAGETGTFTRQTKREEWREKGISRGIQGYENKQVENNV
jgi:hypothetical protein